MLSATEHLVECQGVAEEQAHRFPFPVTWQSLTVSLELDEGSPREGRSELRAEASVEPRLEPYVEPSVETRVTPMVVELIPPQPLPPPPPVADGRWEMVVPQMARRRDKKFEPVMGPRRVPPRANSHLLQPPRFEGLQTQSLFSRALSMFGLRNSRPEEQSRLPVLASREPPRPQPVPKPTLTAAEMAERRAARELLLSKIAKAMRGKGDE